MNKKSFQIFNYGSLGVIAIFLALMLLKAVPFEWFQILLIISIFLFVLRIVLRIYYTIQSKKVTKRS